MSVLLAFGRHAPFYQFFYELPYASAIRNPQKFMEIPKALGADFVKATQRVYTGGADGSKITFRIEE